jgi:predicted component of type VI protein secretion system
MIKLIFTLPSGVLMTHELGEPHLVVGSGIGATVVVPDDSVAESHLELVQHESGYLVADLAGGGLTQLNGHVIEPGSHYQLETGTQIHLGAVEAVYIASEAAVAVEPLGGPPAHAHAADAFAHALASGSADEDLPPGAYPAPRHPPGIFVPLKTQRSLWVFGSIAVTLVAVAAAGYAGYLAVTLPQ